MLLNSGGGEYVNSSENPITEVVTKEMLLHARKSPFAKQIINETFKIFTCMRYAYARMCVYLCICVSVI